ncbi:MAG TPA: PDZ domain-containing protein, partial [Pyrinomonadaceae bacterium]|nr:PDZ domain-containing protein [Pyrinomonadaceae bacterium]
LRVGPLSFEGAFKLRITNPNSAWGKAGVKTGDKLISADGIPTKDWTAFRNWLRKLKVGDTGRLVVEREGITKEIAVTLQPYDVPTVRLVELANASKKQLMLREAWINTR